MRIVESYNTVADLLTILIGTSRRSQFLTHSLEVRQLVSEKYR
jgi:hypothetical protein